MKKYLHISLVLLLLSACVGQPSDTQAIAFCNSFAGTIEKMTLLKSLGYLSETEIITIDSAVLVIGPYCTSELIEPPSSLVISALDQLLLIQLAKRN